MVSKLEKKSKFRPVGHQEDLKWFLTPRIGSRVLAKDDIPITNHGEDPTHSWRARGRVAAIPSPPATPRSSEETYITYTKNLTLTYHLEITVFI